MSRDLQEQPPTQKWIRTSSGWKTFRTVVIINNKRGRVRSEWKAESKVAPENTGFTWRTNSPLVILPGYLARGPVFYFVSVTNDSSENVSCPLTEGFNSLDVTGALQDPRKFGYACQLLQTIIKNENIGVESAIMNHAFAALPRAVHAAISREENLHIVKRLVKVARKHLVERKEPYEDMLEEWKNRKTLTYELQSQINKFKVNKRCRISMKAPVLDELPDECLRLIFHRFTNHQDICHLAQVNRRFNKLCSENLLWKDLSLFHFSDTQLLKQSINLESDWQKLYRTLIRKYPPRELYADMLHLCSHCHYVFWRFSGHLCTYDIRNREHRAPVYIALTPKGLLHLSDV